MLLLWNSGLLVVDHVLLSVHDDQKHAAKYGGGGEGRTQTKGAVPVGVFGRGDVPVLFVSFVYD